MGKAVVFFQYTILCYGPSAVWEEIDKTKRELDFVVSGRAGPDGHLKKCLVLDSKAVLLWIQDKKAALYGQ